MRKAARRKTDYVWDRPGTDLYWFSRAVPKRLWEREGRKAVQFSLGTPDRRAAEALARQHATDLDLRWGIIGSPSLPALSRHVPTEPELDEAAVVVAHDLLLEEADQRRRTLRGKSEAMWRGNAAWAQGELLEQQRRSATGDHSHLGNEITEIIEALGFDLPPDSDGYVQLGDKLNAARLAALKVKARRALGDIEVEADSAIVRRVREREAAKAKAGETIMELFEKWADYSLAKGEKRPDTVTQDRKVIKQFAAFVGLDRAVGSITPVEVAEYRDLLRDLPPRWAANKALRDLPLRDAARKARELDLGRTTFTTVNKQLSTISPLYAWLGTQPAWAGLVNPCNGLFHKKVKGKNRRPSFSTDQLNVMLGSPLFTGFAATGSEHMPGNEHADDWRKWVPLGCLFSGARIGEIAQLRIGDIREERGVWFMHIREDEDEGLTNKSKVNRAAAVHQILIEIGFLEFRDRQLERAGGDLTAPLFPELERNERGQISGKASRWFRHYLTAIGVKNGRDGFGAHSFRHTLADRLRAEAELLDNEIAVCLGHSQQSTTGGYGELPQGTVKKLKSWIDAVRFEGVDFGPLARSKP